MHQGQFPIKSLYHETNTKVSIINFNVLTISLKVKYPSYDTYVLRVKDNLSNRKY